MTIYCVRYNCLLGFIRPYRDRNVHGRVSIFQVALISSLKVLDHVGIGDSSKWIAGTVAYAWFLAEWPLERPGIARQHTWSWIKRCRVSLPPIEQSDTHQVHNAICLCSATHTNPSKRTDSLYLAWMFPVCHITLSWLFLALSLFPFLFPGFDDTKS